MLVEVEVVFTLQIVTMVLVVTVVVPMVLVVLLVDQERMLLLLSVAEAVAEQIVLREVMVVLVSALLDIRYQQRNLDLDLRKQLVD
jgi:hypothetical protein